MKTCIALCFAALLAACENRYEISAAGGPPKEERTLAVSARAVLDVRPDEASIDFTFSSTDKKMTRSHAANTYKIDRFVKALGAAGVAIGDVIYGAVSYAPDWVYENNKPPRVVTYTSTAQLEVKTREFSRIPAIIDAAVDSGLSSMGSTRFYSTRLPELKKQVRDMALKAAREKAEQLAQGLDIGLGPAISVSEGGAFAGPAGGFAGQSFWPYGWGESNISNVSMVENAVAQARAPQSASSEPAGPISPGTTPLELTIDCVFEIQ
jgi:hypothetical protein